MTPMTTAEDRRRLRPIASRLSRLLLAAAALATIGLLAPQRATADYTVVQCVPNLQGYTDATWQPFGAFSIWGRNQCGTAFGLRLDTGSDTGWTANGAGLAWRFSAPPATKFDGVSALVHYGGDGGFAAAAYSNGAPEFNVFTGGPSLWTTASATGATLFEVRLQCFRSPNCHSDWAYAWATNFAATMQDSRPPTLSASGPLLSGGLTRGNKALRADASDQGGGVRAVTLIVNGVLSKVDDFCRPDYQGNSYTHLKPCPSSATRSLSVDTETDPGWANGPNELLICSTDAAGNVSTPCARRVVEVDNSCPGSGGTAASRLDAGADTGNHLADHVFLTSAKQPIIRGMLSDAGGTPISGATICVYETIDLPDASRQLVSTLTTQPNGRFATRLEAGPSRQLDLVYRYNDRLLGDHVELASRVVPTLGLSDKNLANGGAAHFHGRLPGPNADGRAVALQARVGRKWRTFKQLRTDLDGRFSGKYRFTQTFGRVRYTFRALVKRQSGYPYEPGGSRKRKLVVHG